MRAATLISVACLVATGTFVSASGAVADTTHAHGVTATFDGAVPCVTDDALITITYNEVLHRVTPMDGHWHEAFLRTGTFTAVEGSNRTMSGKFTVSDSYNFNPVQFTANKRYSFNLHVLSGLGSGAFYHENDHTNGSADWVDVKVAFVKATCH